MMRKTAKPKTVAKTAPKASAKTSAPKTPSQRSAADKTRPVNLEAEGVLLTDYERDDSAVRKNLERLRTQRLAREAEAERTAPATPKKVKLPKDTRTTAQKLADYIAAQRASAERT